MGILHDLHRHCEHLLERGHKTVSAEYVLGILKRHESEYTPHTDVTATKMIDSSQTMIETITSQNRSQ